MVKAKVLIDYSKYKFLTSLTKEDVLLPKKENVLTTQNTEPNVKEPLEMSENNCEDKADVKTLTNMHKTLHNESLRLQNIAMNNIEDESPSTLQFQDSSKKKKRKKSKIEKPKKTKYWYQGII